MRLNDLRRQGHAPSLVAALLHFDVSFLCWVLLGALGAYVAEDLRLSASAKGLMVAVPLLSAAGFRVLLGLLGDRFGPKKVGTVSLTLVLLPLAWGWLAAGTLPEVLAMGVLLGVAGASFAIALPLASRWYPPELQGVAMGIAGAGNSGTVIATFAAPRLAEAWGWHAVFGAAMVPVGLVLLAFVILAREPRRPAAPAAVSALRALLAEPDARRMAALYSVTFGGFVGLASFLPILLHDGYGLSKVGAATVAAGGGALGSFLRPVGGHLADRHGGTAVLCGVLGTAAALLLFASGLPPVAAASAGFVATMGAFGVGNGAVFQLVGLRYRPQIGAMTGLVGAAGGLGGFCLPLALGLMKQWTGSFGAGLALLAAVAAVALAGLVALRGTWRTGWAAVAGVRV